MRVFSSSLVYFWCTGVLPFSINNTISLFGYSRVLHELLQVKGKWNNCFGLAVDCFSYLW